MLRKSILVVLLIASTLLSTSCATKEKPETVPVVEEKVYDKYTVLNTIEVLGSLEISIPEVPNLFDKNDQQLLFLTNEGTVVTGKFPYGAEIVIMPAGVWLEIAEYIFAAELAKIKYEGWKTQTEELYQTYLKDE